MLGHIYSFVIDIARSSALGRGRRQKVEKWESTTKRTSKCEGKDLHITARGAY